MQRGLVAVLERQEVERVGKQIAAQRGLAYAPPKAGEHVSGRLGGVASLASRPASGGKSIAVGVQGVLF